MKKTITIYLIDIMEETECEDLEKRTRLINFYNDLSPVDKQTLAQIYPWLPYESSRSHDASNVLYNNSIGNR